MKTKNRPDQQSEDKPLSSVDFSALYKEQHPNAVANAVKARAEAAEGNTPERYAVFARAEAISATERAERPDKSPDARKQLLDFADKLKEGAKREAALATKYEDDAGAVCAKIRMGLEH